jgi:broad specificity phosphatase PhoE
MRHAEVENPQKVSYGHLPGFRLSALGRAQATAAGRALRDAGIRRILHSPLDRTVETAELVNAQLPSPVPLIAEPALVEAEFGRYLQGVPYWQIPVRRPAWLVHKVRRGSLPGDESLEQLGGRVRDVIMRLAREHPGEVSMCISHADPIQAAWVLLAGGPQSEREMSRKTVGRAAVLDLTVEDDRVSSIHYIPTPRVKLDQMELSI